MTAWWVLINGNIIQVGKYDFQDYNPGDEQSWEPVAPEDRTFLETFDLDDLMCLKSIPEEPEDSEQE